MHSAWFQERPINLKYHSHFYSPNEKQHQLQTSWNTRKQMHKRKSPTKKINQRISCNTVVLTQKSAPAKSTEKGGKGGHKSKANCRHENVKTKPLIQLLSFLFSVSSPFCPSWRLFSHTAVRLSRERECRKHGCSSSSFYHLVVSC